ncbi:MAG: excinuclease ABC subunit C [Calditrichaeota bacterium]|nr:excinuclease ABC subunit C [Calditrichota bacterium]
MKRKIQEKLENLSTQPGVYLFRNNEGKVLYVGKAKNLRNRVRSYFQENRPLDLKTGVMIRKISDLETIIVDNEVEALILESNLVKKYKPRYNVNLRDDKSYPYIRITSEPIPRIFVTRKIIKDGSKYLGPYTDVRHLRNIMRTVRKIFPIRSCKYYLDDDIIARKKIRVCLDYHIKRCQGPCEGLVSTEEYNRMINQVEKFLRGKTRELLEELNSRMKEEAEALNFEQAARLRDQMEMIENYYFNSQKIVMTDSEDRDVVALAVDGEDACSVIFKIRDGKVIGRQHFYLDGVEDKERNEILSGFLQQYYQDVDMYPNQILLPGEPQEMELITNWLNRKAGHRVELTVPQIGEKKKLIELARKNAAYLLKDLMIQKEKRKDHIAYPVKVLQQDLQLPEPPRIIEAFDISNLQGQDAVGSLVQFYNGKPRKSEYRHFKIRSKFTPDDFAMMHEIVSRRYKRLLEEKGMMPDLILIDGGKGQLSSALQALRELGIKDQPVIGLAKRLEEVFVPNISDPQNIPKSSAGLKLLQQIRDESHRFAITYHRKLRDRRSMKSPLDEIDGIGPKRKASLLRAFGSLKKIREASLEDLVEKGKLPEKIALKLLDAF